MPRKFGFRNDYIIEGEITKIIVVNRKGKRFVILIDTEDLPRLIELDLSWHVRYDKCTNEYYARAIKYHPQTEDRTYYEETILLQRFIMNVTNNVVVDHHNHNRLDNRKENLPEAESRWAEGMHTESYRLTLMMNDLLEINRIKSGRMQFDWKECSLRYLMTRTVNNFKFNYPDREIVLRERLQENEADYVIGDHDKLLQVFTNILDNAAKFSKHDTKVIFDLCSKGGNFIISIKDSGTGISKKDLPRIFEGYYRGRDANREGMGLGLFLAKNIVDEHHGFIHIHSKVNKGTTVEVHLPKAKI